MNRRISAVLTGCAALLTCALAQGQDVTIKTTEVADGIFMLQGKGGNIGYFTGKDGNFMIDDQFAPLTEQIMQAVLEAGAGGPDFVINTHFHGDHTGGNENLGKRGTVIVAHDNVRHRLEMGSTIKAFDMETPPAPGSALPVITFTEEMTFHLNGDTVRVMHAPGGHTDGDSFVHFVDSNVIHAGDLWFNGFFPFIDTDHGGTLLGTIEAADRMLALSNSNTKIIPGHGALGNAARLQEYRDMLVEAEQRLVKLKASGKSAEEASAEDPLADMQEKWGKAIFDSKRWVQIVWDGV